MIIILYENHSNVGEKWVCNIDIIMSGSTMHDVILMIWRIKWFDDIVV